MSFFKGVCAAISGVMRINIAHRLCFQRGDRGSSKTAACLSWKKSLVAIYCLSLSLLHTMAAETPDNFGHVAANILAVKQEIAAAAAAAGATAAAGAATEAAAAAATEAATEAATAAQAAAKVPTLVAVSKLNPPEAILAAMATGQEHFGENYVYELISKAKLLPLGIKWHLIGHLQTNKVKALLKEVASLYSVDSVDSKKLAETLQKEAAANNRQLNILIQVNASGEDQKSGVFGGSWEETQQLAISLASFIVKECPSLLFRGYMTVAKRDRETARLTFERMRQLKEATRCTPEIAQALGDEELELSMGMTEDMDLAIQHGSTQVRIGTRIFGERPTNPNQGK